MVHPDRQTGASNPDGGHRRAESGVALILSLFASIIIVGIVVSGTLMLNAQRTNVETQVRREQAWLFARSGLTNALNWFRNQTTQPVVTFAPVLDTSAVPPTLDTEEPDIGLVREFSITNSVWGRYEVWKAWAGDPDPERRNWRFGHQAEDVSEDRGAGLGRGNAWLLRSVGYVFIRRDENVAFDEAPNVVLASRFLEAEIKRLSLAPVGQGAINARDGNSVHINTNGRVYGGLGGAGIVYPQGSGTPTTGPPHEDRVTGAPALAPIPDYVDSIDAVFGASEDELRALAKDVISAPADFPSPVPEKSLLFVDCPSITFDAARPLKGTGIVIFKGNVTLMPGNASTFNGLLYVNGNLTIRAPCEIRGSIIVTGNLTIQGVPDFANIFYDDEILRALRQEIGQYQFLGARRIYRGR